MAAAVIDRQWHAYVPGDSDLQCSWWQMIAGGYRGTWYTFVFFCYSNCLYLHYFLILKFSKSRRNFREGGRCLAFCKIPTPLIGLLFDVATGCMHRLSFADIREIGCILQPAMALFAWLLPVEAVIRYVSVLQNAKWYNRNMWKGLWNEHAKLWVFYEIPTSKNLIREWHNESDLNIFNLSDKPVRLL